ncbi:MAG: response regulator transcription factor [Eubacteriales bacterium]|nr:response regulator transcription factor [Eubacteriales bacterium]
MFTILVVEDDVELRGLFCAVLSENGYHPLESGDGEEALRMMEHSYVDLIISDIMLPRMDGYELTRAIRRSNMTVPILMVTARDAMVYMRDGFQAGADDYMIKPVDVNEMLWRIRALLRRSQAAHDQRITIGSTTLLCDSYTVVSGQTQTALPPKEFNLLYKLLSAPNRTFTRLQLMDEVWGMESDADPHTLEVHIGRLRERFKTNGDFEIITVRGLGYKAVAGREENS